MLNNKNERALKSISLVSTRSMEIKVYTHAARWNFKVSGLKEQAEEVTYPGFL